MATEVVFKNLSTWIILSLISNLSSLKFQLVFAGDAFEKRFQRKWIDRKATASVSIPFSQHQIELQMRDLTNSLLLQARTVIWIPGKRQLTFWRNSLERSARVEIDFNFTEMRNCPWVHMTSAKFQMFLIALQVWIIASHEHRKYNLLICVQATRSLLKIRTLRHISTALRKWLYQIEE